MLVAEQLAASRVLCTGSILDATPRPDGRPLRLRRGRRARARPRSSRSRPASRTARAPLAERRRAGPSGERGCASTPSYAWSRRSAPDDVAVLALATPARPRAEPTARAVALPAGERALPGGGSRRARGLRTRAAPADSPSGALAVDAPRASTRRDPAATRAHTGVIADNAITLCASSPTERRPATATAAPASSRAGSSPDARRRRQRRRRRAARPAATRSTPTSEHAEVLDFIHGARRGPRARRGEHAPRTFVNLSWQPPLVRRRARSTCASGDWVRARCSLALRVPRPRRGQLLAARARARATCIASGRRSASDPPARSRPPAPAGRPSRQTTPTTAVKAPPPLTVTPLAPLAAVRGTRSACASPSTPRAGSRAGSAPV